MQADERHGWTPRDHPGPLGARHRHAWSETPLLEAARALGKRGEDAHAWAARRIGRVQFGPSYGFQPGRSEWDEEAAALSLHPELRPPALRAR